MRGVGDTVSKGKTLSHTEQDFINKILRPYFKVLEQKYGVLSWDIQDRMQLSKPDFILILPKGKTVMLEIKKSRKELSKKSIFRINRQKAMKEHAEITLGHNYFFVYPENWCTIQENLIRLIED